MTNVSAAESATAKLLGEDEARRIATNIAEHARQYARRHVRWHTHTGCGEPVEKQWETCRRSQKYAWRGIYLVAPRRRTRSVSPCRYGPVLQILQNGFGQGPFLVQTVLLSELRSARFER